MSGKITITSKIDEIYLWIGVFQENVDLALKEACKLDDGYDVIDSLEIIGDRLNSLDHIVGVAQKEAYALNKEK